MSEANWPAVAMATLMVATNGIQFVGQGNVRRTEVANVGAALSSNTEAVIAHFIAQSEADAETLLRCEERLDMAISTVAALREELGDSVGYLTGD